MTNDLREMLNAFITDTDTTRASTILRECLEGKVRRMLNVDVTPSKGAPDNGADIPNMFSTKEIKPRSKKLPKLKKGVYGTGAPPVNASGDSGAASGEGGSGGE